MQSTKKSETTHCTCTSTVAVLLSVMRLDVKVSSLVRCPTAIQPASYGCIYRNTTTLHYQLCSIQLRVQILSRYLREERSDMDNEDVQRVLSKKKKGRATCYMNSTANAIEDVTRVITAWPIKVDS